MHRMKHIAKTYLMVAWSFEFYSYLQLTVLQVSDCYPLGAACFILETFSWDTLSLMNDTCTIDEACMNFLNHRFFNLSSCLAPSLPVEIMRMDSKSIELYKQALEDGMEEDYNIRIMVVGPFGVGKTTFTKRLLCQDVNIDKRNSTDGIDVHVRRCKVSLDTQQWIVDAPGILLLDKIILEYDEVKTSVDFCLVTCIIISKYVDKRR